MIVQDHPLANDPMVDLRELGFEDASSFYSRPNRLTGAVLPGVADTPFARLDLGRRLTRADKFLRTDDEVRKTLGAPARIKIEDAYRPPDVQLFAYDIAWPAVIRAKHPELSDEDVARERDRYVTRPADGSPVSPHSTGGAVDVRLINLDTNEPFNRGHDGGNVTKTAYPDRYEDSDSHDYPSEIVAARRVLYFAMVEVAGLQVNPFEIWHYGIGEPKSEFYAGRSTPYYGLATLT